MSDFQVDVLDKIAQVMGGAVSGTNPHFFNGTPLAGTVGCYSVAPPEIDQMPVGVVLVGEFTSEGIAQGTQEDIDRVTLLLFVAPYRMESQMSALTPFRDAVPAAFRAHRQLFSQPSALDAFVVAGKGGVQEWRGTPFLAYEYTIQVTRDLTVTYSS